MHCATTKNTKTPGHSSSTRAAIFASQACCWATNKSSHPRLVLGLPGGCGHTKIEVRTRLLLFVWCGILYTNIQSLPLFSYNRNLIICFLHDDEIVLFQVDFLHLFCWICCSHVIRRERKSVSLDAATIWTVWWPGLHSRVSLASWFTNYCLFFFSYHLRVFTVFRNCEFMIMIFCRRFQWVLNQYQENYDERNVPEGSHGEQNNNVVILSLLVCCWPDIWFLSPGRSCKPESPAGTELEIAIIVFCLLILQTARENSLRAG